MGLKQAIDNHIEGKHLPYAPFNRREYFCHCGGDIEGEIHDGVGYCTICKEFVQVDEEEEE